MTERPLPRNVCKMIDKAVSAYALRQTDYAHLATRVVDHLMTNHEFAQLIHSTKWREKDPEHLRDKLQRKARVARENGGQFKIDGKSVFTKIDDLAGVRLLHLHSHQIHQIHPKLLEILDFYDYTLIGTPEASSWDIETTTLFEKLKFKIKARPTLYTSIHYIVSPHYTDSRCEIQIRTLAEELWGEVSHTLNYPHETKSIACKEQLLALARLTSGCSRLVDSIVKSKVEYDSMCTQDGA